MIRGGGGVRRSLLFPSTNICSHGFNFSNTLVCFGGFSKKIEKFKRGEIFSIPYCKYMYERSII